MKSFYSMIAKSSSSRSALTDGQTKCSYSRLPAVFENLDGVFTKQGIKIGDCLALECRNTVPSAVMLLYLFFRGYSFFLLPESWQRSLDKGGSLIPGFCRWLVCSQAARAPNESGEFDDPERYFIFCEQTPSNEDRDAQQVLTVEKRAYLGTSGSTASAKIAVYSQDKLLQNALNCCERFALSSCDRVSIVVPISHMYGLAAAFLPAVLVGASINLQEASNIIRYLHQEKAFQPNVTFLTPVFCETLVQARRSTRRYRVTVVAGDRLKKETLLRYEECYGPLLNLYGSTEMGAIAATHAGDPVEMRAGTVGEPMPGVRLMVDEDSNILTQSASNYIGELLCLHEFGFEGYLDHNGKPDNSFGRKPEWFRTKDLGRVRSDGRIEIIGRCDDRTNRNGLLVDCSHIERILMTIAGIQEAFVIPDGESQRGKGITAYCVLRIGAYLTSDDIRRACFEMLQRDAVPDRVILQKSLPRLPNGKIDRQKIIKTQNHEP